MLGETLNIIIPLRRAEFPS